MFPRFLFLPFFLGLLATSCSKNNDTSISEPKAYEEVSDLEEAIDSLYVKTARATKWDSFFVAAWAGDDITTSAYSGKADYRATDQRDQINNNARSEIAWIDGYNVIKEANTIILGSKSQEVSDWEQSNLLVAEAFFLRGYVYHHLTRMFGEIPLQLGKEIDVDAPFSEVVDIYKQIEKDWFSAQESLPMIYPNVEVGAPRPNKGTARAFLSRLYLDWGGFPVKDVSKYALAASSAKQVIDNHTSHGFDLLNDLDDLWTLEHRFNKESIFTMVYCTSCPQGGNYKTGIIGLPNEIGGWAENFGEIKFFETFPDNHRKQATYITDLMIEDPFTNPAETTTKHWTEFRQPNPILAKITGKGDIPRSDFITDRNDYLMRYAEVLLTYAEASARAGNSNAEAWEALNMIRRRAELLPPYEPNAATDLISGDLAELTITERGWELAGEFQRWHDLVRTEQVSHFLDNNYRNDIVSTIANPDNVNFGMRVEETIQIHGSVATDNYFIKVPSNYKELYFLREN